MTFTNLIIGLILFTLIIVVLAQVAKVADLLRNLVSDQEKAEEDSSNLISTIFVLVGVIGTGLLIYSFFASYDKFLPEAASELGRAYDKYFLVIYSVPILLIFFITHILLFMFSYQYRYKVGRKVHYFEESTKLELIWTSVPLVVCLALGISTTGKWLQATGAPGDDAMHIKITGQQFKWFITYPGENNEFGARDIQEYGSINNILGLDPLDNNGYDDLYTDEIVVPIGKEIAFDLSALDVIHDFYLPHFRVKMDAIPGVPTRLKITPDKTTEDMRELTDNPNFEFEIACAELCGSGHWNMKKVLKVVSQEEYEEWLSNQVSAREIYYNDLLAALEKDAEQEKTEEVVPISHDDESHDDSHETATL